MHIPALIFARMDSRRLPGKALRPLGGTAILERVVDRLRHAATLSEIIVCTSDRDIDTPIADFAGSLGIRAFRGDALDVLGRAHAAATWAKADAVVRISGDSPFIDPDLVDRLVTHHRNERPDITTNVHPRTYPPGMSVEVVSAQTLQNLDADVPEGADREHVTPFIYRHERRFRIDNIAMTPAATDVDLALDTEQDYARQVRLMAMLSDNPGIDEIIAAARQIDAPQKESAL